MCINIVNAKNAIEISKNEEKYNRDSLYDMMWAYYLRSDLNTLKVELSDEEMRDFVELAERCWLDFESYTPDNAIIGLAEVINEGVYNIKDLLHFNRRDLFNVVNAKVKTSFC